MSTSLRRLAPAGIISLILPVLLLANPIVNFQGILVDAPSDTIVANGNYDFDFSVYDQPSGGSLIWNELHQNVPVQDGIYAVNLGETSSLEVLDFRAHTYWLEISVNDSPLPTRHQITYSVASMWAAQASRADTANVAANFNIPAAGVNDTQINWGTSANQVSGADVPLLDEFQNSNATNVQDVMDDLDAAIPTNPGDITDVVEGNGLNVSQPQGPQPSVSLDSTFTLTGAEIALSGTAAPLLDMQNSAGLASGDNLWLQSTATNALSGTWVLYSKTYKGSAAVFDKTTDDNEFALEVYSPNNNITGEAIYAWGRGDATAGWYDVVMGANGQIRRLSSIYNSNEEKMIYFTGTSTLSGGRTSIAFDSSVRDVIDSSKPLRVFFTPKNGWSGLYMESSSSDGFNVVTGAGDQQITFDWFAIAPLKERPVTREIMMSPEERAKFQQVNSSR